MSLLRTTAPNLTARAASAGQAAASVVPQTPLRCTEPGRLEGAPSPRAGGRFRRATRAAVLGLCVSMLAVLSFAAPQSAHAQESPYSDSIVLNFEGADIREVIYSLASALEINYWVDPRVSGQVTLRTTGQISRRDLFPIFHQLLRNNGFAAVRNNELYLIVPAEEGKTKIMDPGRRSGASMREDRMVMELVKVRHVNAEQMASTLAPFVSPGGDVIAYPRSNMLVITDLASNARRLVELVGTFDTDTFTEMTARIFPIEHAVLEDLAQEMQSILEAYRVTESGASAYLIPLMRLNGLAVIAVDTQVFAYVKYWLDMLDVPSEAGSRRQVYVYQVENSKAVDLASVLSQVYSGDGGSGSSSSTRRGRSSDAAEEGVGLGGGLGSSRRGNRSGREGSRDRGRSSGGGASSIVLGGGENADSELFEQELRIVEDEVTNSLVILATPRDYQTLRTVLRRLDIVPRQVLIEVLVAEISLDENEDFSVTQQLMRGNEDSAITGDGQQGGAFFDALGKEMQLAGALGSGGLGATIGHFRNGLNIYQGVLNTVLSSSKSKILSRPHLMTADNQEARIVIGDEVPVVTGQAGNDISTVVSVRNTVQYRETGLIIKVLPQVNSAGLVNLDLDLELSAINGDTTSQLADIGLGSPTFTKREAETNVVVHSGDTLVIGGIIRETVNEARAGVPYLMDVPVIGRLFRSDSDASNRTELIVLITPFVVRDREESRSVTEEFKRQVDSVIGELDLGNKELQHGHTVVLESAR